ncbi:DUF6519 domain-containing protein [Nonomuraea angiospora]|uniref:DUF6519 domain-containing protein n=1 Tax=Nonomuraea angiospora TaxID=46172 RepID=UPI0033F152C5
MHGDFSNLTFSPERGYSAVFDLQGRVGLDANRNEQTAILLHQLRGALADLMGPHAGPAGPALGFAIADPAVADFTIGAGRYYVNGIGVENPAETTYAKQPHAVLDVAGADRLPKGRYLVYLKVWERHVTEVEDPTLHEPALGPHHPDTSSRAQVVWQVRAVPVATGDVPVETRVADWIAAAESPEHRGVLQVRATRPHEADDDPCTAPSDAGYTGENQLYRVEIRGGGTAREGASFAWSRDNGSVIYPILASDGPVVQVSSLGRDRHTALEVGQWVEAVDDAVSLRRELGWPSPAAPLRQVVDVDVDLSTVTLDPPPPAIDRRRHPYLRRWDHTPPGKSPDGAIPVTEAQAARKDAGWIPLERGVEVRFLTGERGNPHRYRTGDYWVFPARRTLGDVIWHHPQGRGPHGVAYHYAPLAVVEGDTVTGWRTSFALPLTHGL